MTQLVAREVLVMGSAEDKTIGADNRIVAAAVPGAGTAEMVEQRQDIMPLDIVRCRVAEDAGEGHAMMPVEVGAGHGHAIL